MRDSARILAEWLETGGNVFGEIGIRRVGAGFELCHRDDAGRDDLAAHNGAEAARELAAYDDAGTFRPLKTAPNLRHGWKLALADVAGLRHALDYFYPAMLGVWCSHLRGELVPVPLRATLARQTGMYRVTQKISDAQAQAMIADFCRSDCGCLKTILWQLEPGKPIASLPPEKFVIAGFTESASEWASGGGPNSVNAATATATAFPLLCHEACNLLVAKAREVVKSGEIAT